MSNQTSNGQQRTNAEILAEGAQTVEPKKELRPVLDFEWSPVWAEEFFGADCRQDWLCKGILVVGQPAVIGGPVKTLKTSIGLDLALSLASGTKFLGKFPCPERKRVAFMSAESGKPTLQRMAKAILAAKGVPQEDVYDSFAIHCALPQLSNARQVAALHDGLRKDRIESVFLDPLYLALLAGGTGTTARAENLYEIGPLLLNVAHACMDAGAQPKLMHHTRKGAGRDPNEPLDLTDLAFSGVAEFARQWILLSRREKYDLRSMDRKHELWMVAGGSAGHSGQYAVSVYEGKRASEEIEQPVQEWKVTVSSCAQAQAADKDAAQAERAKAEEEKHHRHEAQLLHALDAIDLTRKGAVKNKVKGRSGLNTDNFDAAMYRLIDKKTIEEVEIEAGAGGNNARKSVTGIRRPPKGDQRVSHQKNQQTDNQQTGHF
jgi:hypothetical protein